MFSYFTNTQFYLMDLCLDSALTFTAINYVIQSYALTRKAKKSQEVVNLVLIIP